MQHRSIVVAALAAVSGHACGQVRQLTFVDASADVGLGGISTGRVCFADLNGDARPDAILDRRRIFLNVVDPDAKHGLRFAEVLDTGLPEPRDGDCLVFADLDNDGHADAILTRYLDVNADGFEPPADGPGRTAWFPGNGDGSFGEAHEIPAAGPRTTACVAVGDVNLDGRLDLYLGNWYVEYGGGYEGYPNDLLLQTDDAGEPRFERVALPRDDETFDEASDLAGRPTYGVMLPRLLDGDVVCLLDLNYGRRWNRLSPVRVVDGGELAVRDEAMALGVAGDAITHGRHPDWLKERAKTDPRFDRADEPPFRANGNSFDASVGDVDDDGDFDLFVTEIAHAWAGDSSDRSRFLVDAGADAPAPRFRSPDALGVDRVPADPTIKTWNEGDLFAQIADLDLDGRLDLLLSSGDYPDDQRLRLYRRQEDGSLADVTAWVGLANDGSQQLSLADVDLDGDLDVLVGQTFFRMGAPQRAGRTPTAKLYLNQAVERGLGRSLVLRLEGDPEAGVSRDALGAIVRATALINGERRTFSRQLVGVGGHAGKQMGFEVCLGLGDAGAIERLEIRWPDAAGTTTVLDDLAPGRATVRLTPDGAVVERE